MTGERAVDTDAIRSHFGIPHAPQTQELDAIDRLCGEVDRLRVAVEVADKVWRCQRCNGAQPDPPAFCGWANNGMGDDR